MKLNDIITAAGARVSGGDPYQWHCFGPNAQYMEFKDVDGHGYCHCIFDTEDYFVYQIHLEIPLSSNEAETTEQSFQWTNPDYIPEYNAECEERKIDPSIAYDSVKYNIIYDDALMLKYVKDIGEGYYDDLPLPEPEVGLDGRVEVPLTLSDKETFRLMTLAHEADMTLNKYVEKILSEEIINRKNSGFTMPMPGTMGGATVVFPEETLHYTVNLDVRFEFSVDAKTSDEALEKAKYFQETMKSSWGEGQDVSWVYNSVVKESVERNIDV